MHRIDEDSVARVVIPYFLRTLMRQERERIGDVQTAASFKAGWSSTAWGVIERGARPLDRKQWRQAVRVLGLRIPEIVRRFDAFVRKNPSIWIESQPDKRLSICKRPATSPRVLRSGKVVNVDLDPLRPHLYHELATYFEEDAEVIAAAVSYDLYKAKPVKLPSGDRESSPLVSGTPPENRREFVVSVIRELSPEKFGLMERVVDKFMRFSASDLARAYEHFSLSIRKR